MSEATQALLTISQEDRLIRLNKKKLAKIPPQKEILRKPLNLIEKRLNELKAKVVKIQSQIALRNKLIGVEKAKHELSNEKMMAVSNQKEYGALQKEIDAAGRVIRHTEEQILALEESIAPIDTEVTSEQEAFDAEEANFNDKAKDIHSLEAELESAISSSQTVKTKLTPQIPEELKAKYEFLTSKNIIPAALEISSASCSGCAMAIRFQVFNDIIRETMGDCPTCGRLLFYKAPEPVPEPEPKKKAKAKPKEKKPTKAALAKLAKAEAAEAKAAALEAESKQDSEPPAE